MSKLRVLWNNEIGAGSNLDAATAFIISILLVTVFFTAAQNVYDIYETPKFEAVVIGTCERLTTTPGLLSSDGGTNWENDPDNVTDLGLSSDEILMYGVVQLDDQGEIINVLSRYVPSWCDYSWIGQYTCFLAGTPVVMADGSYKNIDEINVGEYVKSFDEQTKEIVNGKVVDILQHSPDEMGDYYLVINDKISVTPNHRFYVDGNWIHAEKLEIGDNLYCPTKDIIVNTIDRFYQKEFTYNLEIEDNHNYFIAIEEMDSASTTELDTVLVHNDGNRAVTSTPLGESEPLEDHVMHPHEYTYTFVANDPDGDIVGFEVDWGDGNVVDYRAAEYRVNSGEPLLLTHKWYICGIETNDTVFTIRARAWDWDSGGSGWGDWSEGLDVDVQGFLEANFTWRAINNNNSDKRVVFNLSNCIGDTAWYHWVNYDLEYNGTFNYSYYQEYQGLWGPGVTDMLEMPQYGSNTVALCIRKLVYNWGDQRHYSFCSNIFVDTVEVYWDQEPMAMFDWEDADDGGPQTIIDFDASLSTDDDTTIENESNGKIVKIEWDWSFVPDWRYEENGDSRFCFNDNEWYSEEAGNLSTNWIVQHDEYPGKETPYHVALRVTDALGQMDTTDEWVEGFIDSGQTAMFYYHDADGYGLGTNIIFNATYSTWDNDRNLTNVFWDMDGDGTLENQSYAPNFLWEIEKNFSSEEWNTVQLYIATNGPYPFFDKIFARKTVKPLPAPNITWWDNDGDGPGTELSFDPINSKYWGIEYGLRSAPSYSRDGNGLIILFIKDYNPSYTPIYWPEPTEVYSDTYWDFGLNSTGFTTGEIQNILMGDTIAHNIGFLFITIGGLYLLNYTVQATDDPDPVVDFLGLDPNQYDNESIVNFYWQNFTYDYLQTGDPDYAPYGYNGITKVEWIWNFNYSIYNETKFLEQGVDDWCSDSAGNITKNWSYDYEVPVTKWVALRVTGGPPDYQTSGIVKPVKAGRTSWANFTWYDKDGIGENSTLFFNASTSVWLNGVIGNYCWDWDGLGAPIDNITNQTTIEHDYGDYNRHTAYLAIIPLASGGDLFYAIDTNRSDVQPFPGPHFNGTDADGSGQETVINFDATRSDDYITTWNISSWNISKVQWDFNYSGNPGEFNPMRWYNESNMTLTTSYNWNDTFEHNVGLRLLDEFGRESFVFNKTVKAIDAPTFNADFIWEDADGDGFGTVIDFYAWTNLTICEEIEFGINYSWDWTSDGSYDNKTSSRLISYEYPTPDPYIVTLKVENNQGEYYILTDTIQASVYPSGRWNDDGSDDYWWSGVLASKHDSLPEGPGIYIVYQALPNDPGYYSYIVYRESSSERYVLDSDKVTNLHHVPYNTFIQGLGLDDYGFGIGVEISWFDTILNRNGIVKYGLSDNIEGVGNTISKQVVILRKPQITSPNSVVHPQRYDGKITVRVIEYYISENEEFPEITIDAVSTPTSPTPLDGASGIGLTVDMNVDVSDINGDSITVYFYDSMSHNTFDSNGNNTNETDSDVSVSGQWTGLSSGTRYNWYVVVDDGLLQISSDIWRFTTTFNPPEAPDD